MNDSHITGENIGEIATDNLYMPVDLKNEENANTNYYGGYNYDPYATPAGNYATPGNVLLDLSNSSNQYDAY